MLVLTRRPGETLIIELPTGEQIEVTVLEVKGNQVRIGTDAPSDIAIVCVVDRCLQKSPQKKSQRLFRRKDAG
jgi:carbon storage regulator